MPFTTHTGSHPLSIMNHVVRAMDALVDAGEPFEGLFPSLLDRETCGMLTRMPPPIPGLRNGDRSHLGSNLIHDEATLKTLYALAKALDRPDYSEAADRYSRTRVAAGYRPVIRQAREDMQTGLWQNAFSKMIPSRASRSRLGV